MITIEQYYNWFYLDKESANSKISNCKIPLRIAPIKTVNNYENPKIDNEHFAFAEKNKNWIIEYFHWLNNFLRIKKNEDPPIFIFDNHNHAPIFRYYTTKESKLNPPILIHIDQHSDCRENKETLTINQNEYNFEKVFYFFNKKCNVWNFIPTSLKSWIISNQIQIRSISALKNLKLKTNENYILDIDLDFCLSWTDRNKTDTNNINILKTKFHKIWNNVLCTTIATSPYFLDQEIAIKILSTILTDN